MATGGGLWVAAGAAWYLFPGHRFVVIPAVIVVIYLVTIYVLLTRPRGTPALRQPL